MAKETITMTRDLFDEMLVSVRVRELRRCVSVLEDMVDKMSEGDGSVLVEAIARLNAE